MIDKLKVYGIQFKKLGLATFWWGGGATFGGGGRYFGGPLLSGFTSGHKRIDVNFGRSLLSGSRYYRNFTVCYSPLVEKTAGFLAAKKD